MEDGRRGRLLLVDQPWKDDGFEPPLGRGKLSKDVRLLGE